MPITIPDNTQIRLVTDFSDPQNGHALPSMQAKVAFTNPGPVAIDPAAASNGQAQVVQAAGDAGRAGYIGYNPDKGVGAGQALSPSRNVLVDGFLGVTPGTEVYIDATSADNSGTASGLTHTKPGTGTVLDPIGVGWGPTKIFFF